MDGDAQNFRPPVLVGERVAWLGSGSGLPQPSTVRWIGRIPEITSGWTVGIELDRAMPVGGIDGTWRKRKLFSCEPKRGLLVPIDKIMKESSLLKTRHSLGEKFYDEGRTPVKQSSQDLIRKLSLPQSASSQEFISRVLPPADRRSKAHPSDPPVVALNFKKAVNLIKNVEGDKISVKPVSPEFAVKTSAKTAPLTIANVRTLDSLGRVNTLPIETQIAPVQNLRQQTLDELEKFKKHLDELERLKNFDHSSKSRRKKLGKNPESLYDLAKPTPELQESLFLRIIGEKKNLLVETPKQRLVLRNNGEQSKSYEEKIQDKDGTLILHEQRKFESNSTAELKEKAVGSEEKLILIKSERNESKPKLSKALDTKEAAPSVLVDIETTKGFEVDKTDELKKKSVENNEEPSIKQSVVAENSRQHLRNQAEPKLSKSLDIKAATLSVLPDLETPIDLNVDKSENFLAEEKFEENLFTEVSVSSEVEVKSPIVDEESESVSPPTATIRKKRQRDAKTPVPTPRRRSSDGRQWREDQSENADTTSVLYEPAFLRAYLDAEAQRAMSSVRGTFRRIDEDELDGRSPAGPSARRLLSASVSAPGGPRKGLFSFLKWFRKSKPQDDLDLEAFNAPSITSSPLFARNHLANAGSVDTLYSIATVSSFAFVPGARYQSALIGSDRRKKRRAPPPPTPPPRRDVSLPNTLEGHTRQLHRRSASESYKDRRSGAFAHVHGKRKAPPPPVPPPRDRLYPTLTSVRDGSLSKKKRPAPKPPDSSTEETVAGEVVVACDTSTDRVSENNDVEHLPQPLTTNDSSTPKPGNSNLCEMSVPTKDENVVCNDTLRLERGVLKPNKAVPLSFVPPEVAKVVPSSPVSPRPWYKRKSLEKRKEKFSDDWMPEVGIARPPVSPDVSPLKFNFFSRGEDKKKEEKRKSGLSILANISELDREAAEICRKEQVHQQQISAADDAKFYADIVTDAAAETEADIPKRNSTRELISLFNSIGNVTKITVNPSVCVIENIVSEKQTPVALCNKPEIKTATVVGTKDFVNEEVPPVEPGAVAASPKAIRAPSYELRARRQHSPSPVSTIEELSEPSSSAATLNQYSEPVWTCTRCTLENLQWKNRCDACSSCKPSFNRTKKQNTSDKRKSEMEFEIDWERELQKYFPIKNPPPAEEEISAQLTLSKTGDVVIRTETKKGDDPKEGDLDELRRKRLAFFMKSLGNEAMTSLRDAAAKKSLDEAEKSKLKGMLKEMKDSLPKYAAVKNNATGRNSNATRSGSESLPDGNVSQNDNRKDDGARYGAIRKIRRDDTKPAEALLVTTTTVLEDITVKKKKPVEAASERKEPVLSVPVYQFSTVGLKNGEPYTSLKKARRVGDGPFELMRARDLANIIESKTGTTYPAHVYANYPNQQVSDASFASDSSSGSSGREMARLATQLTRASGVAEFKATLDPSAADTLAVNRLLRRLEAAIAAGRHDQAATLARELAGLKVNCFVTRQRPSPSPSPTAITVEMYVEDKVSHQGPIPVRVQRSMTLADLKTKIQADFQIPCHVQRWILGKHLATEDFRTLEDLGVSVERCAIFLYLVAPDPEAPEKDTTPSAPEKENGPEEAEGMTNPRMGKGWYFNYEEDRYSYCESESDDNSERELAQVEKTAAVRVIQRTIENARGKSKSSSPPIANGGEKQKKIEDPVLQPAAQAKPFSPKQQRPPFKASHSLPEQETNKLPEIKPNQPATPSSQEPSTSANFKAGGNECLEGGNKRTDEAELPGGKSRSMPPEKNGVVASPSGPSRPRSRSIFDLIKPQSNDTLKKDLKVISVNAVKETIEKLTRRTEDLQRNGWKCDVCTLVNAATRPGCAACTAPRPLGYATPTPSPAEEELRRLRRDQAFDLSIKEPEPEDGDNTDKQHYLQLVNLDSADCVANTEPFECPVCLMPHENGEGVVLRECLHTFCRACLVQTVEFNEEAEVKCPYRDVSYSCESVLQQREIKALVPRRVFEQHLARSVAQAENRMGNAFHCKTPDCQGWCVLDDNVNEFRCPVCSHVNCLTCQAVHEGLNCRAYQDRLKSSSETNVEAKRTRSMLEDMVQRGDAMACPTCQVVLMKKWGCDWLRCSMCKTEICWVTRGPRWGPAGKGDTSAGCQCGLNGVKCHPKCNYCH